MKSMDEMTLEELWELFPILLAAHDPAWKTQFAQEAALLRGALPAESVARIEHIGSTAVAGIWAKPTVDILVELRPGAARDALVPALSRCGYGCMSQSGARASFQKGYTPQGFAEKVFHLHVRPFGDHDELYFRDYLCAHPEAAKAYEALKLSLWAPFRNDRDGYTAAKADFVREYTARAKREFQNRYE